MLKLMTFFARRRLLTTLCPYPAGVRCLPSTVDPGRRQGRDHTMLPCRRLYGVRRQTAPRRAQVPLLPGRHAERTCRLHVKVNHTNFVEDCFFLWKNNIEASALPMIVTKPSTGIKNPHQASKIGTRVPLDLTKYFRKTTERIFEKRTVSLLPVLA